MPRVEEHYKFPCGYEYTFNANGWTIMGRIKPNVDVMCPIHGDKCRKK